MGHKISKSSLVFKALSQNTTSSGTIATSSLFSADNHQQTKQQLQQYRTIVTNLSDGDAVSKFGEINEKSILYFTATWCPPCKMISPIYSKLSDENKNISFGKVDIDDNQDSAMKFEISAVPTFIFLHNGDIKARVSGADQVQLEANIKELDGF